jgi:hypothetical protein
MTQNNNKSNWGSITANAFGPVKRHSTHDDWKEFYDETGYYYFRKGYYSYISSDQQCTTDRCTTTTDRCTTTTTNTSNGTRFKHYKIDNQNYIVKMNTEENNIPITIAEVMESNIGKFAKTLLAEMDTPDYNFEYNDDDYLKNIFMVLARNPHKTIQLLSLMEAKIDDKIKSGEINETELIAEAIDIFSKTGISWNNYKNIFRMVSQECSSIGPINEQLCPVDQWDEVEYGGEYYYFHSSKYACVEDQTRHWMYLIPHKIVHFGNKQYIVIEEEDERIFKVEEYENMTAADLDAPSSAHIQIADPKPESKRPKNCCIS